MRAAGILNRVSPNILLYADDIALITESETDIQLLLDVEKDEKWVLCSGSFPIYSGKTL